MAVKDFPTGLVADAEEWRVTYNTQSFESDLNGAIQTAELPGARWSVQMTFSNRQGISARALQGFLASLRGRSGRFYVTPADWEQLGNPAGSGVVATATTGSSIDTSGWDPNITGLFYIGDYFEVNGELKKMDADINSDASGLATLTFSPPLRKQVTAGMVIRVTRPRAVMMLASDDQARWSTSAPVIYSLTINGQEALDI